MADPESSPASLPVTISTKQFAAGLAICLLLRYGLVLVGLESFTLRDFTLFGYPLAAYLHDSFWAGELPLWNPYSNCGLPFLAQWNTLVCYPPSLIYCLFPVSWSLNLFCLLHLYVGGLGMFILARHWLAHGPAAALTGLAYAFSGLVMNSLMWPNNIAALGCLPWVMWAVDRACLEGGRRIIAAALISALQMLTGAPEIILCTWVIVGFIWLARQVAGSTVKGLTTTGREIGRLASVIGLTSALAAVQLLPFHQLLGASGRGSGIGHDLWAAPPHFWANYLAPLFRVIDKEDGTIYLWAQSWTHSHYAGIGILLLAALALIHSRNWRTYALALLTVAALVAAVGSKWGLYDLLRQLGPIGQMRYPVKLLIIPTVLLPLLAGIGLKTALDKGWSEIRASFLVLLLLLVSAFGTIGVWIATDGGTLTLVRHLAWASWRHGLIFTALPVLLALVCHHRAQARHGLHWTVAGLLVVLADLNFHHPNLNPTVPRSLWTVPLVVGHEDRLPDLKQGRIAISPSANLVHQIATGKSPEHTLVGRRMTLPSNVNLIRRAPRVGGFYSLTLAATDDFARMLYRSPTTLHPPVADFLGVGQDLIENDGLSWRPRDSALPLVTAGQQPYFAPNDEIPSLLTAADYDPRQFVFIHPDHAADLPITNPVPAKVSELKITSHQIEFGISCPAPTLAVVAQSHYGPWQATIDGKPTEIIPANRAFQAVGVPAGEHRIVLRYVDSRFRMGLAISLVTLIVSLLMLVRKKAAPEMEAAEILQL
jgi:hypothetical protein